MSGRRGADPAVGDVDLLAEILRGVPKLPGAACAESPRTWDGETAADIAAAKAGCSRCPCFLECSAFAEGRRGLTGVWAGTLKFPTSGTKKRRRHRPSDDEREGTP